MMAFFLLLWMLGATTEKQRKGIADYFAPTLVNTQKLGIGGCGPLGGESIDVEQERPARRPAQTSDRVDGYPGPAVQGGPEVGTGHKGSLQAAAQR